VLRPNTTVSTSRQTFYTSDNVHNRSTAYRCPSVHNQLQSTTVHSAKATPWTTGPAYRLRHVPWRCGNTQSCNNQQRLQVAYESDTRRTANYTQTTTTFQQQSVSRWLHSTGTRRRQDMHTDTNHSVWSAASTARAAVICWLPWRWKQQALPKRLYLYTTLHVVLPSKLRICINTVARTSNPANVLINTFIGRNVKLKGTETSFNSATLTEWWYMDDGQAQPTQEVSRKQKKSLFPGLPALA
jgi:hypothetical protein